MTLHYLRHDGPEHVILVAPSRSGKGVGSVIPTLLSWPHSVIVHDIKRENWPLTAGWRQGELGSRCIEFNPTDKSGTTAKYNPLLDVRMDNDVRDAEIIAHEVIPVEGITPHWSLASRTFLKGLLLHQLYAGRNKSLAGCHRVLTDPTRPLKDVLEAIVTTDHDPWGQYNWVDPETKQPVRQHPTVTSEVRAVQNMSDRERASVISMTLEKLSNYTEPTIANNTKTSDFSIRCFDRENVSLYLTTPASDLERVSALSRLFFSLMVLRRLEKLEATKGVADHRVLLMMDEASELGGMEEFFSKLAHTAGYGLKCFLVLQNLNQLEKIGGRHNAILGNCKIKVFYAPDEIETAEILSRMLDDRTVMTPSFTYTGSRFSPIRTNVIASLNESRRRLMTPGEVMKMEAERVLIFIGNASPIDARKIRFYEDREFMRRSAIPAPTRSDTMPDLSPWTYVAPQAVQMEQPTVSDGRKVESLL